MITANDVNMKRFEQARPGYKTEEVDEFLKEIADQLEEMIREKDDSENKIGILVESIREYKNDEEALKEALIGAHKQAKVVTAQAEEEAAAIVAEAKAKADAIIAEANAKADEIIGSTGIRAEKARAEFNNMKKEVSDFKSEILGMYKKHITLITSLPDLSDDETDQQSADPAPAKAPEKVRPTGREKAADTPADMDSTVVFGTPEAASNHLNSLKK